MTWQHGASGYRSYGCRCEVCTTAHRERHNREKAARRARPGEIPHGTESGMSNWGCHCDACRAADRVKQARSRARRKIMAGRPELMSALERQAIEEVSP